MTDKIIKELAVAKISAFQAIVVALIAGVAGVATTLISTGFFDDKDSLQMTIEQLERELENSESALAIEKQEKSRLLSEVGTRLQGIEKDIASIDVNQEGEDNEETLSKIKQIETEIENLRAQLRPPSNQLSQDALHKVVNVRSNDVLNVRSGPSADTSIIGSIPPDGRGVEITGLGKQIGESYWVPIKYKQTTGWVNRYYLDEQ